MFSQSKRAFFILFTQIVPTLHILNYENLIKCRLLAFLILKIHVIYCRNFCLIGTRRQIYSLIK